MELSPRLEGKIFFLAHDLLLSFGVITVFMTLSWFISAISPKLVTCRESGSKCFSTYLPGGERLWPCHSTKHLGG